MNDLVPMIGDGEKISPWEKPGGTLGLVVAGGALGGGAILLYKILPWLITLTSNILTLSLLVGALFLIAFLVTDKRFRKTVSMIYFLIMRKITGLVIEIDPIAIVEMKVKEMREKITVIKKQISNVKGLVDLNTKKVEQKKIELARQINLLNEYRKRGDTEHAIVVERQVVRLQSSVDRQQKRLEESRKWNDILDKLKERAMLVVEDTENEVADRKDEYESIKAQHKAFSSIMSIIKGSPDELADFTYAMDFMAKDMTLRLREMSDVIDETGGLLTQMNVEDAITSQRANELLRLYEENGIEGLFGNGRKKLESKKSVFDVSQLANMDYIEAQTPVEVGQNTNRINYLGD